MVVKHRQSSFFKRAQFILGVAVVSIGIVSFAKVLGYLPQIQGMGDSVLLTLAAIGSIIGGISLFFNSFRKGSIY